MLGISSQFESLKSYLQFYGLEFEDAQVEHSFLEFKTTGFNLAGHIFQPREHKGIVLAVHGYLSHCGLISHLIRYVVKQGYAAACFDLPGHGLSGGSRAAIEDFSQYSEALRDFAEILKLHIDGPKYLIGHSLGGGIIADYLLSGQGREFKSVTLAAPLVRCAFWKMSKCGYRLNSFLKLDVPWVYMKTSSDAEFMKFIRYKDKLHGRYVPAQWVEALYRWNKKMEKTEAVKREINILQGDIDISVDWKYNIEFLQSKFAGTQVCFIKNGRHELFNEAAAIRSDVLSKTGEWL